MSDAVEVIGTPESGDSLLAAISREMVKTMKSAYGRGPTETKSYLLDDLLFVVMRGGITDAERTMLDAGEDDLVRAFRQRFENVMAERLIAIIEDLTGRKVLNYQSQVIFDPDLIIEIFVFEKRSGGRAPTAENDHADIVGFG